MNTHLQGLVAGQQLAVPSLLLLHLRRSSFSLFLQPRVHFTETWVEHEEYCEQGIQTPGLMTNGTGDCVDTHRYNL